MKKVTPIVLALAGPIAAGKGTAAEFLEKELGFGIIRTRDIIGILVQADGKTVDDSTLQEYGARLMTEEGSIAFCDTVARQIDPQKSYVIDSLRPVAHLKLLRDRLPNLQLAYVYASQDERRKRFTARPGRHNTVEAFAVREAHPSEQEVAKLMDYADLAMINGDEDLFTVRLKMLVLSMQYGSTVLFQELIEAVKSFHIKHGYDVNTGNTRVMSYRVGKMIEEVGEIHACISKGKKGIDIEHADVLYLLLGNCVTLGIDLEECFFRKHGIVMQRPARMVDGNVVVSDWNGEE